MSDKSISEAKFTLQELLMDKVGLTASKHIDSLDHAKDKTALGEAVTKVATALMAANKTDAAKALTHAWALMRGKL